MTTPEQIIQFLQEQRYPLATRAICRKCYMKEEYDANEAQYNNRVQITPDRGSVQRTYRVLRKLKDENKIKYVERGMWAKI